MTERGKPRSRADDIIAERQAVREADAREYHDAIGERRISTLDDIRGREKPEWITTRLTEGLFGLAGPAEAGKSLLIRDWSVDIAASERHVLYAMSEGHFDVEDRFDAHPLIDEADKFVHFLEEPISLASKEDVNWLMAQFRDGLTLATFDMVYGFGLPDDGGMRDVAPVIGGGKRLAREMHCAVMFVGHPGHNGERRFRGSSMWRGSFDGEFHMADGRFTCEKHKYTDKRRFAGDYTVEWPYIKRLTRAEANDASQERDRLIDASLRNEPGLSVRARAVKLAPLLGLSAERTRKHVAARKKVADMRDADRGSGRGESAG